jgi:arabinan endo-1,5-alpha-L-arabinosidase
LDIKSSVEDRTLFFWSGSPEAVFNYTDTLNPPRTKNIKNANIPVQAPDVHYQGGTYYMYYVLSKLGTQTSQIGVATSTTMEPGSWTDHGIIGIPANSAYNRIDPNWITIGGKQYIQFGSYWQDIYQVALESPLQVGSNTPHQIAYNASLNHRVEGAFLYQHGSFYYLFFSGGIAGSYTATYPAQGEEYRIHVCRSSSGTGGFVSGFVIGDARHSCPGVSA